MAEFNVEDKKTLRENRDLCIVIPNRQNSVEAGGFSLHEYFQKCPAARKSYSQKQKMTPCGERNKS